MGLNIEERYDEFLKACQANDLETVEDLIFDRTFRLDVNRSLKDGANAIIIAWIWYRIDWNSEKGNKKDGGGGKSDYKCIYG